MSKLFIPLYINKSYLNQSFLIFDNNLYIYKDNSISMDYSKVL